METTQLLFEEGVPLVIHNAEREDVHTTVTVKIHLATRSPTHRKVLHAQLTDDSDPFFFFSLDVTEEDFQSLKNEQGLKPDFANFPAKVIELLQLCISCASKQNPAYIAELTNKNNQSTLQIIKTDDFKNLVPLSLVFRPGNDVAIKKYLAEKLGEFKNSSISLKKSLDDTRTSLTKRAEAAEARAIDLSHALDERVAESNRALAELRAEMSSHLAAERERTLVTSQGILQKGEEDRKILIAKYESTTSNLTQTIHRLESENKELLDAKYRLEADVKDITAQLHSTKVELTHCKQEITSLRAENKALDGAMHEHEKNVTGHKIKISAVEQHISDKDELLSKMSALLESTNAQKVSMEESLNLVKSNLKEAEERVATLRSEIKKGNQIIATLQTALKTNKSKSAKRGELIQKLQSDLSAKDLQILNLQGDAAKIQAQKEATQHELEILKETEISLKHRLEECKQIISNNNNVIEFLQKDLLRQKEGTLSSTLPSHPSSTYLFGNTDSASLSASNYKFRPKYTPSTKSSSFSSGASTSPIFSSAQNTPFPNPSTSSIPKTSTPSTNTSTTNLPTPHSSHPPSHTSPHPLPHYPSYPQNATFTQQHPSTPKSVLYNPPASQLRSFAPSN
eukprot:Phypoly_transcript_05236.p1 GENE.Phypoly_transcript_05236~~Phypoly_transcript_05236.p1  ORF type:complete len:626 (+),score=156.93 Phypoly_transcript_05236:97-1974(+)